MIDDGQRRWWFDGGENGKIHGKVMNAARQISRRLGRTIGARTRSDSSDCIVRTVSFGADPLKAELVLRAVDADGAW